MKLSYLKQKIESGSAHRSPSFQFQEYEPFKPGKHVYGALFRSGIPVGKHIHACFFLRIFCFLLIISQNSRQ